MFGLQYFGFEELWSPYLLVFLLAVVAVYLYAIGPWRLRVASTEPPVRGLRKFWFIAGVFLFYMAQGGPLDLLGHMMFSFHMLSMSMSYLIVPPLILLGVPEWLWRKLLSWKGLRKLSFLMHPIFTAVLFNMLFSLYHVPQILDTIMTHYTIHTLYYLLMLVTAFMMWWPVVNPVPEWNRLTDMRRIGYIFLNGVLLTPACALIIFAGSPMYATYNDPSVWAVAMGYCVPGDPALLLQMFDGPTFFNLMPALDDQQLGGIIMKLIQEIMYGSILAYVFYQWYRRERAHDDDDIVDGGEQENRFNPNAGLLNRS